MSTDPPPLADLLKHRPFLERFARRLVRDASAAEDVVQETWLTALERPPAERGNLRAWLMQVARNAVLRRQRSWTASPSFETLAEEPPAESDASGERESIARLLGAELLALPEPYRGVLILRYYEDKTPTEIARELDRPVNTVTSQLARGLKLMEARLDRAQPGGRSEWLRVLVALVPDAAPTDVRSAPLEHSTRSARTKAWLGVAVVAVTVAAIVLTARGSSRWLGTRTDSVANGAVILAPPNASTQSDPGPAPLSAAPDPRAPVDVTAAEASPAAGPEPEPAGSVIVDVVTADGQPVAQALVQTTRRSTPPGFSEPITTFDGENYTDASGRVEIPMTVEQRARLGMEDVDQLGVVVNAVGFVISDVHAMPFPERGPVSLTVRLVGPAADVRGTVTDVEGHPIENAWVEIGRGRQQRIPLAEGRFLVQGPVMRRSRADGTFEHLGLPPGELGVWVECPGYVPHSGSFQALASSTTVHDIVLRRGGTVTGRAETADGHPASGAEVKVEFMPNGPNLVVQTATADADGRFTLEGMLPGQAWLLARQDELSAATSMTLTEGERRAWNPVLRETPALRLRVLGEDGSPLAGAVVVLESTRSEDSWQRFLTTGADGLVRFDAVPEGELVASVFLTTGDVDAGVPPCHAVKVRRGADEHALVVPRERLGRGSLSGRILDHEGKPFAQAMLQLRSNGGTFFYPTSVAAETGEFRNDRLTTQTYEMVAWCAGYGTVRLDEIELFDGDAFDLGEIRLPRPIVWSAVWPDPAAPAGDAYELVKVDALTGLEKLWMVASGAGPPPPSFALFPGHYEWLVYREGRQLLRKTFDVD